MFFITIKAESLFSFNGNHNALIRDKSSFLDLPLKELAQNRYNSHGDLVLSGEIGRIIS